MQRHSTSKEHSGAKAGRALPVWDSPSRVLFPGGLISWCQLPFAAPLTRGHQQFCAHIRKNIWWLEIKMIFLVSSCVSTKAAIYPWVYFPLQAMRSSQELLNCCIFVCQGAGECAKWRRRAFLLRKSQGKRPAGDAQRTKQTGRVKIALCIQN